MSDETRQEEMPTDDDAVVGEVIDPDPDDAGFELPDDPEEAVTVLVGEVMDARTKAESHLDDLKRLAAEFDNFRKRAVRDRDELIMRASQGLIARLLPVLDTFDAALANEATTEAEQRLLAGMQSTRDQLMEALRAEGLAVIPAAGEPFDPAVHEAVSGGGTGHLVVTAELRRGYTLSGRVLRPALVAVAAEDVAENGEG